MAVDKVIKDSSIDASSLDKTKQLRTRRSNIEGKYSQDDFRNLSEEEQVFLLNKYLFETESKHFEDGTFQFSRTTLTKLAEELGYKKSYIRTDSSLSNVSYKKHLDNVIYIDRGRREQSIEKKITLSQSTNDKLNQLLGSTLSNIEKSKTLDAILEKAIDDLLLKKQDGSFGISYRQTEAKRIL